MGKSSNKSASTKDFPLTRRADGRWQKKIKGQIHYFTGTQQDALEEWLRVKDDLLAGREPRPAIDGVTVLEACDRFLVAKRQQVESGELTERSWRDYKRNCDSIIEQFGKTRVVLDLRPEDFEKLKAEWSKKLGIVRISNEIQRTRVLLKYLHDSNLIGNPVRVGPMFKRASRKALRIHKAQQVRDRGAKLFEAVEIRDMISQAGPAIKAMIFLAINAGMGNSDVANLPLDFIKGDWLDYPRPKTGVARRCPLWPETVAAIEAYKLKRPQPKNPAANDLLFITKYGEPWFARNVNDSPVSKEFRKLTGANHRKGVSFYALRHTFRTIASAAKDEPAANLIMGHADDSMAENYTQQVSDDRLQAVVDHVRRWLFPVVQDKPKPKPKRRAFVRVVRR